VHESHNPIITAKNLNHVMRGFLVMANREGELSSVGANALVDMLFLLCISPIEERLCIAAVTTLPHYSEITTMNSYPSVCIS
jgi:hypothetical protein